MNLYKLSTSYQQIQSMIEDGQEGLEDTLESINDAIEEKAVGYAKVIRNLEGQANAIKEEEKRLADRRKHLESNIKRLKDFLEASMINNDIRKIKTELFSFNIQKNPPSVNITNEDYIPKRFLIEQPPKIDKKSLLKELKEMNKTKMPGVEIVQGESLRIR